MTAYRTLSWQGNALRLLDQRRLPGTLTYVDLTTVEEVAEAIRNMTVRGAPAIGVAAVYGLALATQHIVAIRSSSPLNDLTQAATLLRQARPTAVNLAWAIDRVMRLALASASLPLAEWRDGLLAVAERMAAEDVETNRRIGLNALPLIPQKAVFYHHCNTGALATVDYGTALGVIRTAHEAGRQVFVYVDETRPRLQGARLTAWELQQLGIPFALVVDGASAHIMRTKRVDLVTVGCDRIAANGDVANKVGTFNLALAARAHAIPFYSVGPTSTIDLSTQSGEDIPIEEREAGEITTIEGIPITAPNTPVFNPAFDITPAEYITAIITEIGVVYPPFTANLPWVVHPT
jgi:methylthioribose-1-phosphate isomerase